MFTGNINILPAYVANDVGIFEANCLEMEMVNITSSPNGLALAVTGEIDFVITQTDLNLVSKENGLEIRIVATLAGRIGNVLVAAAGTPLPNEAAGYPDIMNDVVGKTIGVTGLNAGTHTSARALFEGAGLDGESATYVAVGGGPTQVAAVVNGTVDFAMMPGNGAEIIEALGAGTIVADPRMPGDWGPLINALTGTTAVWTATEAYLDANSDVARRFAKANSEAIAFATDPANRDVVFEIAQKYAPITGVPDPEEVQRATVDIWIAGMSDTISRTAIDGWNEYSLSLGQTQAEVPFEEIVWDGSSDYFAP